MTGIRSNRVNGIKRFGQEGGYYVAMVGNVTEHAVKKYRQEQARKEESEESANRSGGWALAPRQFLACIQSDDYSLLTGYRPRR